MNIEKEIRSEEILLLGLCRLTFTEAQKEKLSEVASTVTDWDYFVFLANEHGLAALTGYNLLQLDMGTKIPAEVISTLNNAHLKTIGRNAFLSEVMSEVLESLNNNGIKTVLLKGMALELTEYGNKGLRQMTDVDIYIDNKQCMQARDIFLENGFESLPLKSPLHKSILTYTGKHLPSLIKDGASIEIHHKLFGDKKNTLTQLLAKESVKASLNSQRVFVPAPRLFFLYLVRHLQGHEMNNESQLRLYTDLYILLDKYGDQIIDFDLLELVTKAGMSDILAWKLQLLRDFWGLALPGWINEFIEERYHPDTVNRFVFFLKHPKHNPPLNKAFLYRQIVKDIPGLYRKILFLTGDIFPSFTFMKKRYNCNSNLEALIHYPPRIGKVWWLIKKTR
jgi:hypothetical protein